MSAIDVARRMQGEVAEHKHLAQHHRRQARARARALEEFCRRNGIELELLTKSEEGHGHGEDGAAPAA